MLLNRRIEKRLVVQSCVQPGLPCQSSDRVRWLGSAPLKPRGTLMHRPAVRPPPDAAGCVWEPGVGQNNRQPGRYAAAQTWPLLQPGLLSLRSSLLIELFDQLVEIAHLVLEQGAPVFRVPLFRQFVRCLPLLLDPSVILEVVDRLPLRVSQFLEVINSLCAIGPA